eukprot:4641722-Pyramimonas_sp.AAC.1
MAGPSTTHTPGCEAPHVRHHKQSPIQSDMWRRSKEKRGRNKYNCHTMNSMCYPRSEEINMQSTEDRSGRNETYEHHSRQ